MAIDCAIALLEHYLKTGGFITYKELGEKIGADARQVETLLDFITAICENRGLPIISVMVGEEVTDEVNKVKEYGEWESLLEELKALG